MKWAHIVLVDRSDFGEGGTSKREMSIIKPKRRVGASHLEKGVDLGGEYSLAGMMQSGFEDTQDANQALLDEFKIQDGVKMYRRLPEYGDFLGFYVANDADSVVISKRAYGDFRNRHFQLLNSFPNTSIPKKLRRAVGALRAQDKRMNLSENDCFDG